MKFFNFFALVFLIAVFTLNSVDAKRTCVVRAKQQAVSKVSTSAAVKQEVPNVATTAAVEPEVPNVATTSTVKQVPTITVASSTKQVPTITVASTTKQVPTVTVTSTTSQVTRKTKTAPKNRTAITSKQLRPSPVPEAIKEFKDFEFSAFGALDLMPKMIEDGNESKEEEGAYYVVEVSIDKKTFLKKYKVEKIELNGKPVKSDKIFYDSDSEGFRFYSLDYKIDADNVIEIFIRNTETNEKFVKKLEHVETEIAE